MEITTTQEATMAKARYCGEDDFFCSVGCQVHGTHRDWALTNPREQLAAPTVTDPQEAWDSERRDSPYSTVADPDDESYCEGCDQLVDYSDGSKHGRCGCGV